MRKTGRSRDKEQTGERQRYLPLKEFAREALWDTVMVSGLAFVEEALEIDVSGSTAALDVVWDSQADKDDATIPPIPSSYEGVPVEQHIIETVDLTSALMSASN